MTTSSLPPGGNRGGNRGYKRSWRNLLINKRYQLRFTLFMVGLATLLMAALGFWVMRVANDATEVAKADVLGTQCDSVAPFEGETVDPDEPDPDELPAIPMKLEPAGKPPVVPDPAVDDDDAGSAKPRRKIDVILDDMTVPAPLPVEPVVRKVQPELKAKYIEQHICRMSIPASLDKLEQRRLHILLVLIGSGLLLAVGLAIFGIKMTHKVAGPLFKVGLYLAKMRDGRLDKVYNLRKGDQLVSFYDHFKEAHAGVVKMQHEDIARAKAVIAAAEAAGAGDHAAVAELRTLVARKEKALE
ncbi:MAG: hypothetical protein WKG01_36860 [Kofleriaceae bacterium]